jgi:cytoskeletal protein RodZ
LHVDKESLKAEMKKLEKTQEKVKNMQKLQRKDERVAKKGKTILICILYY